MDEFVCPLFNGGKYEHKNSKNNCIELWRFIFTICVAVMHFGYINGFYIAVDYFFMLSGYLTAKKVKEKGGDLSGSDFFFRKIQRLWSRYFFAYILMLIWNVWFRGIIFDEIYCVDSLLELSFLHILLPASNINNGITWYISAMLVCMPLVIFLLKYHNHVFSCIVAPVFALVIYSFFLSCWGHVDFGLVWIGLCNGGLIRGAAGLCAGVFLYYFSERYDAFFKGINFNLLSFIEMVIGFFVITISIFYRGTKFDIVNIVLLGILIILSFKDGGWLSRITSNQIIGYLGKISYSIYLNQLFVGSLVKLILPNDIDTRICTLIYVFVLICFSGITDYLLEIFSYYIKIRFRIYIYISVFVIFWIISIFSGKVSGESFGNLVYKNQSMDNIVHDSEDIHCSIDYCNGVSVLDENKYTISAYDEIVMLEGWAEKISSEELVDSVMVRCNDIEHDATLGLEREDVVKSLGNDDLLKCGWQIELSIEEILDDDDKVIEIVVIKGSESKTFLFYFEFE